MQPVRHEVAQQARAIGKLFPPAMERIGAERNLFLHGTLPTLPIDVFRSGFAFDRIIPLATEAITAVVTLTPDERANLAALNNLRAFMPATSGAALGTNLENLPGLLDRVIHLERLWEIPCERFLTIDMFACLHGVDGDTGMPRIVRGDEDGINIIALQELAMIDIDIRVLEFGSLFPPITAFAEQIASGRDHGIVGIGILV